METIGGAARESLPPAIGPYSLAVTWNNMVFVSGLVALRPDGKKIAGDVREQAMVVLRNLEAVLEEAGSGMDKVLMVNVCLDDIGEVSAFNEVYEEFFAPPYPARSIAGIDLPRGFLLEVWAVAFKEGDGS
jgi:2-iminobutanoate/2-iminopropanoate deaminase